MYNLIVSALYFVLSWIVRSIIVKFVFFFALFFITTEFITVIIKWLPQSTNLPDLFSMLPDSVWYWLNLFNIPIGVSMTLSAFALRFIIRRIPVIG